MSQFATGRIGFILALSVAAANPAFGQRVSLGFEGGVRSTKVAATPDDDEVRLGSQQGATAGVSLSIDINRVVGLRTGVRYAGKGTNMTIDLSGPFFGSVPTFEASMRFAYLELPFLLALTIPSGRARGVGPYFLLGPVVGARVECGIEVSYQGQTQTATCADDDDDLELDTAPVELGLLFGAGVRIPAGPVRATLEFGYNVGLTDVDRAPDGSLKNRGLAVSAGIMIPIRGGR